MTLSRKAGAENEFQKLFLFGARARKMLLFNASDARDVTMETGENEDRSLLYDRASGPESSNARYPTLKLAFEFLRMRLKDN